MSDVNIKHELSHNIKGEGQAAELVIRTGEAPKPPREPEPIDIEGNIDSVRRWLENRISTIDPLKSFIIVNRERLSIALVINEHGPCTDTVTGRLDLHPTFIEFDINTAAFKTAMQWAEMFKFKRKFFENHSIAMKIVSELKNLKANIQRKMEQSGDSRGDRRFLIDQVVTSNIPESFKLTLPIFKGEEPQTFDVEFYFSPDDLTCSLVSAEAADLIETVRDQIIDLEVKELQKFAIAIIEK